MASVKNTTSSLIAEALLKVQAVKLSPEQPFQWASGWKSPIYCDNRITLSYPQVRTLIKEKLVELIQLQFPSVSCIAGVATAGIPQGALVADLMKLPFLYVRSSPKSHGMQNLIEGTADKNAKIVVIEDLISTGGSSLKAAEALRQAGYNVLGMAAVFTYNFQVAVDNFQAADLPFYALSNYDDLIQIALEKGIIEEKLTKTLQAWRLSPHTWK
jgi:orotate phosphoribosyltransferase